MSERLRIGIAGLGTVGAGVVDVLQRRGPEIAERAGKALEIAAVSARDRARDRGVSIGAYRWEDDPERLAQSGDIDVLIELIGGEEGVARRAVEKAIAAGKHVVTANKALLAKHGSELAKAAEENSVALKLEAAVAGGIPAVKALSEGMAANGMGKVAGVMNGTCNHILTRMESTGMSYSQAFEEASQLGYLEADPNLDVGGIDAAHKLAILASIAFGTEIDFGGVRIEGIQKIDAADIEQARDMGFRIRLLGVARMAGTGLEQRMEPCLVPESSPLGQLEGATNMIVLEGDSAGQIVLRGAGAGAGPTASAVLSDAVDIARGFIGPALGKPAGLLARAARARSSAPAPYYVRLALRDRPGALAEVAAELARAGISINRMRQYAHTGSPSAPVIIVTHACERESLMEAAGRIDASEVSMLEPVTMRIETS